MSGSEELAADAKPETKPALADAKSETKPESSETKPASPEVESEVEPVHEPSASASSESPEAPSADADSISPLTVLVLVGLLAVVLYAVYPGSGQGAGDVEALLKKGSAVARSRELGGPQQALKYFQEAVQAAPDDPRTNASLGRALTELNRFDEAVPCLLTARKQAPTSHDIQLYLGMALTGLERHKEAREALEAAIRSDPKDPRPLYFLGIGSMRLGEHADTVRFLQPFVRDVERNPVAWRIYADALGNLGREEEAIAALTSLTRLTPKDVPARRELQDRRMRLEGFAPVLEEAAREASAEGAGPEELYLHARLLTLHPDYAEQARAALEHLKERYPKLARADLDLAQEDARDGDVEGAKRRLEAIIDANPASGEAKARLADVELQAGQFAAALEIYKGLLGGGYTAHAHLGIVTAYIDQGQGDEALAFAQGILAEAQPGDPRRWALQGDVLQRLGKFEEAGAVLEALLEKGREVDWPIWYGYRAFLELERGEGALAQAAFDKLLDGAGDRRPPSDLCLWAGITAGANGDLAKARALWSRGAKGPEHGQPALYTRSCKRLLGEASKRELLAAARLAGYRYTNDALFVEGLRAESAGDLPGAKAAYAEALAATRGEEFPARLINRALERLR